MKTILMIINKAKDILNDDVRIPKAKKMIKEQTVQECDARNDAMKNKSWSHKNSYKIISE
ncbi:MAG: hypothetical protein ACR2FN_10570 [Chitinophagaceae bacterium]